MITIIKDSLPLPLMRQCLDESQKQFLSNQLRTNCGWGQDLVQESTPVFIYDLPEGSLKDQILECLCNVKEIPEFTESNVLFHYWTRGSYIPWHTDAGFKAGVTIYLNDRWGRDDGGLFLYREDEQIKGLIPEFNMMVVQVGGTDHCVTPITRVGSIRASIQIFLK
jgi:Rps23 Pro-64 3,4-dihydroxylase Tpa1-like proline 4-hydroxylase